MFGLRLFGGSLITSSCSIQLQSYKFYLFFAIFFFYIMETIVLYTKIFKEVEL